MPRSVIEELLREEETADAVVDSSPELEAVEEVAEEQLAARAAAAPEPATAPKIAADFAGQVDQAIAQCSQLATSYGTAVKTASESDRAGYAEMGELFAKVAHLLSEQKKVSAGYAKYAQTVLETSAADSCLAQTLKVASELLDDGSIELPSDKTLLSFISELSKRDLAAVKVAHELFSGQRMQELGSAVARERPVDEMPRADGSTASWLAYHRSLSGE